jgi:hypothetical protein
MLPGRRFAADLRRNARMRHIVKYFQNPNWPDPHPNGAAADVCKISAYLAGVTWA